MDEYPIQGEPTSFEEIYDRFFGKITDDMYLEWTEMDTRKDLLNILIDSIPQFEFPRFPLYDYTVYAQEEKDSDPTLKDHYNCHLTSEEINIFALYMLNAWLQRQITSVENTRQKYSGADFKMTSQANHLDKLITLKKETERQAFHMQRLYKRRKIIDDKGSIKSNWSTLAENSALDDG